MGIKPVQNQFNGGEISPLMAARFDLPVYQYSAAVMLNFIPTSEGYIKRRGGTHFVASAKEVDAVLFKIIPNVEGALIIINNVEQESCYCAPGDLVSYTVSAEGYQTQSGTYTVNGNTNLNVNLVSNTIKYQVNISATPEDAEVIINDVKRNSIIAGANSRIEWSVSKSGYKTQDGVIEALSENKSINVQLKMRFSVKASPEGAKIIINGVERSYMDVDQGTVVNWSVSKSGYQTQSGSQTVNNSVEIVVSLSSQVPGQVMFESSTPGTYNVKLEDGLYDILMCGAGGSGFSFGFLGSSHVWNGGSGAVFSGVIKVSENIISIKVGEPVIEDVYGISARASSSTSEFSNIINCEGGYGGSFYKTGEYIANKGGKINILEPDVIISQKIASNGNDGIVYTYSKKDPGINYAPLPDEYKTTYGFGGKASTSGRGNLGGNGFVRLVYVGKEA